MKLFYQFSEKYTKPDKGAEEFERSFGFKANCFFRRFQGKTPAGYHDYLRTDRPVFPFKCFPEKNCYEEFDVVTFAHLQLNSFVLSLDLRNFYAFTNLKRVVQHF